MSEYIDAEKLVAEIEKKKKILISEYNELAKYEVWRSANDNKIKIYTISDILSLITSLQQEQPEVDLDKEVKRWKNKHGVVGMDNLWLNFARHFYELGLNARKEK